MQCKTRQGPVGITHSLTIPVRANPSPHHRPAAIHYIHSKTGGGPAQPRTLGPFPRSGPLQPCKTRRETSLLLLASWVMDIRGLTNTVVHPAPS